MATESAHSAASDETAAIRADLQRLREDLGKLAETVTRVAESEAAHASERLKAAGGRVLSEAERRAAQLRDGAAAGATAAGRQVEEHPFASIAVAFGVGMLVSRLLQR